MTKEGIESLLVGLALDGEGNSVDGGYALDPAFVGAAMYEPPLIGYASANDAYFATLQKPHVVGRHHRAPSQWLAGAATVISCFMPLTAEVRDSNLADMAWPSGLWLHARIEGQQFINTLAAALRDALIADGHESVAPSLHPEFETANFSSNWSERHAAYTAGLGTFGLSAGIITRKGMAGRLFSVITTLELEPDAREYNGVYDWCCLCGMCMGNCPVGAITVDGKNHSKCSLFLDAVKKREAPRYGCGKCQVAVPCERRAPGRQ